jgi:hypothetical protein
MTGKKPHRTKRNSPEPQPKIERSRSYISPVAGERGEGLGAFRIKNSRRTFYANGERKRRILPQRTQRTQREEDLWLLKSGFVFYLFFALR